MKGILFSAILLVLTPASFAAGDTFIVNGVAYRIGIPGEWSECMPTDDGGTCTNKEEFVVVGPDGCGDSFGSGYCGRSPLKDLVDTVSNELSCSDGEFFILTTGEIPGRCKTDSSGKRCVSLDGTSHASASCEYGCIGASGQSACRIGIAPTMEHPDD